MAKKQISPNRMELMRLGKRLGTARRGHRLLKDKRDGLMQAFMELIYNCRDLRKKADKLLISAMADLAAASAAVGPEVMAEALMDGKGNLEILAKTRNVMSVNVPDFSPAFTGEENIDIKELPYGTALTSAEMDAAVLALQQVFPVLMELAEAEKTVQLLADEIEKTRRRVNSLEHVLIPELEESIREIRMKMDENERSNLTRLMKVKDMLVEEEIMKKRKREGIAE